MDKSKVVELAIKAGFIFPRDREGNVLDAACELLTDFAALIEEEIKASSKFRYVNVTTKGCEGTLNLFFDDHCLSFVNHAGLANQIRKEIKVVPPATPILTKTKIK